MTRDLTIPLGPYRELTLRVPEQQLTEVDWQVLLAVLDAMRPGLVEPEVVDAEIASPLRLTPDEAIEVSLILDDYIARGEAIIRRGTDVVQLRDQLIAHERSDDA